LESGEHVTKKEFDAKAIRQAEKAIQVPPGWWGSWRDVHGPVGVRVKFSAHGNVWVLRLSNVLIGKFHSRGTAIAKGRKLA
jgi:hypothetical protein